MCVCAWDPHTGTDEGRLIRALTIATKAQMARINAQYMLRYEQTLVTQVAG